MRKSIKRNNPPKAFAGAAVAIGSAIASLIGSGISAYNAKKNADAQRREQEYQNSLISAQSMTDAMNQSQALQDTYDRQTRMIVRCGGRRKMKYGGSNSSTGRMEQGVTSQFPLIPIAPGLYYDNSRKHESGGNKIKKNGKTILEEEKGEVLDLRNTGEAKVLSSLKEIGTGGMSPAELVLAGENPDVAYNIQENKKKGMERKSIKKMRLGGWNEDWGDSGTKYGDAYNAGINVLTNAVNTGLGLWAANSMKAPSAPILMSRSALPTRYSIGAQLGAVGNSAARSRDYVNRNSISSAASRSAIETINENEASQINQLYGNKANTENELVSANTRYLDEGRQNNLNLINQHRQNLVDYANQRRALQSNAWQTGIASLSDTADNLHKTIETRNQNRINAWSTMMTANPETLRYAVELDEKGARLALGDELVDKILANKYYATKRLSSPITPTYSYSGINYNNIAPIDQKKFKIIKFPKIRYGGRKSLKRK